MRISFMIYQKKKIEIEESSNNVPIPKKDIVLRQVMYI